MIRRYWFLCSFVWTFALFPQDNNNISSYCQNQSDHPAIISIDEILQLSCEERMELYNLYHETYNYTFDDQWNNYESFDLLAQLYDQIPLSSSALSVEKKQHLRNLTYTICNHRKVMPFASTKCIRSLLCVMGRRDSPLSPLKVTNQNFSLSILDIAYKRSIIHEFSGEHDRYNCSFLHKVISSIKTNTLTKQRSTLLKKIIAYMPQKMLTSQDSRGESVVTKILRRKGEGVVPATIHLLENGGTIAFQQNRFQINPEIVDTIKNNLEQTLSDLPENASVRDHVNTALHQLNNTGNMPENNENVTQTNEILTHMINKR